MPRTPLLRSLRCLFRDARLARAHGLSLEALREVRAAHAERDPGGRGISRRAFLAHCRCSPRRRPSSRGSRSRRPNPTVVIVGAGIAGLNCALELADLGIREHGVRSLGPHRRPDVHATPATGSANQITEWCGELIDTGHTTIRRLAARFDLPLDNLLAPSPTGPTTSTISSAATIRRARRIRISSPCPTESPPTPRPPASPPRSTPTRRRAGRWIG